MTSKTILISGASSALANSCYDLFLKKKYSLVLISRSKKKINKDILNNKNVFFINYDLNKKNDLLKLEKILIKKNLIINSFLHFDGHLDFKTIHNINDEDFINAYNVNVYSFIKLLKLFSKKNFFATKSSVVNISSVSSLNGSKGMSLYSSSKAAINNLIKSYSLELAHKNIRINNIILGHIDIGMGKKTTNFLPPQYVLELKRKHPLGFGNFKDLFYSIEFLINERKSKWITGTSLFVDGGFSAN